MPAPPRKLSLANFVELAAIVEEGPDLEKDGVVRWRQSDLKRVIKERFGVIMQERTVDKQLELIGFTAPSSLGIEHLAGSAHTTASKFIDARQLLP